MKTYTPRLAAVLVLTAVTFWPCASPAFGQVLTESDYANSSGYAPNTANDLLLNLFPSSASPAQPSGNENTATSWLVLTDGSFGSVGVTDSTAAAITNGNSLTYMLDTAAQPGGYTINNIATYSGWNDSGRINQTYAVAYSTVASPNVWIPLNTVNYSAPGGNSTEIDLGGTLTGVAGLQFNFGSQQNGYVGYREITATLASSAASAGEGYFSMSLIGSGNQDANEGLNPNKTYLNAVNLNGGSLSINGVMFASSSGANPSGPNFVVSNVPITWPQGTYSTTTGQLGNLLSTFIWGGTPGQLTLTNLVPGQTYVNTFYEAPYEPAGNRLQNFTTTSGASTVFDQDLGAANNEPDNAANMLRYTFVASGTSETLTFSPQDSNNTLHLYGFTTEQVFNNLWTGAGGTQWSSSGNWSLTAPDYAGANASFPAAATPSSVMLDQPITVGHLQFAGTNSWTVSGSNTLTLQTDPGGVSVLAALAGTHTIAAPLSMENNVVKYGSGTLVLAGSVGSQGNTLTIAAGTLQFGNGATGGPAVPFDGSIADNATLAFNQSSAQSYSGTITGSGNLVQSGSGRLTLGGQNLYGGATVVNGGTLQLGGAVAAAAHYPFDGNTRDVSGNGNNGTLAGATYTTGEFGQALALNGSQSVVVPGSASLRISGAYTVSAWFNLNNQGMAGNANGLVSTRFGEDNTFDMKVNGPGQSIHGDIGDGTNFFSVGADISGISFSANQWHMVTYVVSTSGAQLYFDGTDEQNLTWSGSTPVFMTSAASAQMQIGLSSGSEYMNGAIDDVYVIPGAISAAQVDALYTRFGPGNLPSTTPLQLSASGTLDFNGRDQTVQSLSGAGTIANSSSSAVTLTVAPLGATTFSGSLQDGAGQTSLVLGGSGQLVLSGSNSYTGETIVSDGTLVLLSGSALPSGANVAVGDAAAFGISLAPVIGSSAPLAASPAAPVPEPSSLLLFAGLAILAPLCRKSRLVGRGDRAFARTCYGPRFGRREC